MTCYGQTLTKTLTDGVKMIEESRLLLVLMSSVNFLTDMTLILYVVRIRYLLCSLCYPVFIVQYLLATVDIPLLWTTTKVMFTLAFIEFYGEGDTVRNKGRRQNNGKK